MMERRLDKLIVIIKVKYIVVILIVYTNLKQLADVYFILNIYLSYINIKYKNINHIFLYFQLQY